MSSDVHDGPPREGDTWIGVVGGDVGTTHVYPINDLREHYTGVGEKCWCCPEHDEEDNIFLHNSMDGREKFETGERKMS